MIVNNLLFLFFAIKNTLLEKKYAQSILGRFTFTVTVYAFKVSTFLQSSVSLSVWDMLYFESTVRAKSPICHILRKQILVLLDKA